MAEAVPLVSATPPSMARPRRVEISFICSPPNIRWRRAGPFGFGSLRRFNIDEHQPSPPHVRFVIGRYRTGGPSSSTHLHPYGGFDASHVVVTVSLPVLVSPEDPGAPALQAGGDRPEAASCGLKRLGPGYREDAARQM